MVRNFLRILALMAAATVTAPALCLAQEPDLAGVYQCEGQNPNGRRYRGVVEISKNEDTYRLRWTTSRETTSLGIGIVNGDALSVGFFDGARTGVVIYKIEKGPRLVGKWTVFGADGHVYQETLTRLGMNASVPLDPGPGIEPVPTSPERSAAARTVAARQAKTVRRWP